LTALAHVSPAQHDERSLDQADGAFLAAVESDNERAGLIYQERRHLRNHQLPLLSRLGEIYRCFTLDP
jgi:hypothetical protein